MRLTPPLLLAALLPLLGGCQMLADKPVDPLVGTIRMQGVLSAAGGQLLFTPCTESRRFVVNDAGDTGVLQEAANLADKGGDSLFADLRGKLGGGSQAGSDGQFDVQRLYRIETSASACSDPNFKQLTLHASGHGPDWDVKASGKGMVLERAGQAPLALPFLEEQMPGGRLSLSSEANEQRIELWLAPQRCVDSASGAVHHLQAELRVDGQTLHGCGYYGGSRVD
ncbi:hypothetical protein G7009_16580 [Pseudomonas capeferrum]|uniref:COG3650 family protein n=1 Tax=Pseudomonas capeferrum TaxID=1495066 RepID=UPI0015E32FCD|nr:hypothetical protein [Pseudomonas capeferrum]MBA1203345.1 hypothetical protein [Pseudomonas capeferrum]